MSIQILIGGQDYTKYNVYLVYKNGKGPGDEEFIFDFLRIKLRE